MIEFDLSFGINETRLQISGLEAGCRLVIKNGYCVGVWVLQAGRLKQCGAVYDGACSDFKNEKRLQASGLEVFLNLYQILE